MPGSERAYPLLKSYNTVAVRKTGTGKVPLHWTPRKGIHTLLFENSVRKFFAWEEAHALFCRYFDRFSVARVNSLTSSALTHLERAKAYQAHFVPTLKSL